MIFGLAYGLGTVVEAAAKAFGAKADSASIFGMAAATLVGVADPVGCALFGAKAVSSDFPNSEKTKEIIGTVMAAGGLITGASSMSKKS